ncbi:MAG: hypothetical protein M3O35_06580 [Acidobacteriota bacterium]|nr:hypothetical protein [Acidobacteriota bacterium]
MQAAKERPYHIQAIYDLQADYSTAHFRFAVGECRKVVAQLIADDHSSDQQIARVNILRYLDLQLSRAMAWADGETDLLAMVLRSEVELRGWAEFVSENPEQATRFLNDEVVIDANELDQKMRKAFPGAPFAALPNVPKAKRVEPPHIGQTVDYDFKLCSKLIHPSALMLNHPEMTIRNGDHKAYLAVEVLLYAWAIVSRFHDLVYHD